MGAVVGREEVRGALLSIERRVRLLALFERLKPIKGVLGRGKCEMRYVYMIG